MQLGPAEILVVLVIALLIFGPNKLPEVGRQVGHAYREVRRFQRSLTSEMSDVFAEDVSDGAARAPSLPPKPPSTNADDPVKSDAVKSDPAKSDPVVPETANPDPAVTAPVESDPAADGTPRTDSPGDEKAER